MVVLTRGDDHHRGVALETGMTQHLRAFTIRQAQIQQHQVDVAGVMIQHGQGICTTARQRHHMALHAQFVDQRLAEHRVVLDQQVAGGRAHEHLDAGAARNALELGEMVGVLRSTADEEGVVAPGAALGEVELVIRPDGRPNLAAAQAAGRAG